MTDSLCRKGKLADSIIPCDVTGCCTFLVDSVVRGLDKREYLVIIWDNFC